MAYKKYFYRNGKRFGPYFYESYRDKNGKVRKRYVGTVNPKEKSRKKSQIFLLLKRIVTPTNFFLLLLIFFIVFLVFGMVFFINNFKSKFTGFAISSDMTEMEKQAVLYENEIVNQEINANSVVLEVREPVKSNEAETKNKNKRMDFELKEGKLRLYFDLLNYSEFVENVAEIVALDNVTVVNVPEEVNVSEPEVNVSVMPEENVSLIPEENVSVISEENVSVVENVTVPEENAGVIENATPEFLEEISPDETPTEPVEKDKKEKEEKKEEKEEKEEKQEKEEVREEEKQTGYGVTGNIIKFFKFTGKVTGGFFKGFLSVTTKAIGIELNESQANETTNNQNQEAVQAKEVSGGEIRDKVEELTDEEVEEIADSSVVSAENFEIVGSVLNKTEDSRFAGKPEGFKWGYKVRLNDLKFMAKIEVTSEEKISVYDDNSLKIGRNFLSFKDLSDAGYKIRFETPALEIPAGNLSVEINASVIQDIVSENVSEIVNNTEENNAGEINASEINASEQTQSQEQTGYGITEGISGNIVRFFGIVGRVIETANPLSPDNGISTIVEDIKYKNTVTIYIERDMALEDAVSQVNYEDMDGDGKLNVGDIINLDPELIIIPISDAEHLDSNKSFISNIYDYVKEKDDNWSEIIPINDFVRVTFSKALGKNNDITIYARKADSGSNETNNSAEIEVYRENGNETIARFTNITSEGWYKIYLTELNESESYDVFDLRILNTENVLVNNSVNISINGQEVPYDIYQKKKRIDELRRLLNQG